MHAAHFTQAGQELGSASTLHCLIEGVHQLCETMSILIFFFIKPNIHITLRGHYILNNCFNMRDCMGCRSFSNLYFSSVLLRLLNYLYYFPGFDTEKCVCIKLK